MSHYLCTLVRVYGASLLVCRPCLLPLHPCFFMNTMSTNYINIGTINHGNKDLTINVPAGTNVTDIVRAFMSDAEEVETVDDSQPIPEFKYIHIEVTDENERAKVHKMMCNIVRLPRMQQVCDELYKLMKNRKVLCTINPEAMLKELRRIGLPGEDQEGFSQKNFQHYYRAPKLD